jgi:hypothetical protein
MSWVSSVPSASTLNRPVLFLPRLVSYPLSVTIRPCTEPIFAASEMHSTTTGEVICSYGIATAFGRSWKHSLTTGMEKVSETLDLYPGRTRTCMFARGVIPVCLCAYLSTALQRRVCIDPRFLYLHAAAALFATKCTLHRDVEEPQSRSGRQGEKKILDHTRTRTPTPRSSSPSTIGTLSWNGRSETLASVTCSCPYNVVN